MSKTERNHHLTGRMRRRVFAVMIAAAMVIPQETAFAAEVHDVEIIEESSEAILDTAADAAGTETGTKDTGKADSADTFAAETFKEAEASELSEGSETVEIIEEAVSEEAEEASEDKEETVSCNTADETGDEVSDKSLDDAEEGKGTLTFSVESGKTKTVSSNDCSGIDVTEKDNGDRQSVRIEITKAGNYTLEGEGKNVYVEIAQGVEDAAITLNALKLDDSELYEASGSDLSVISGGSGSRYILNMESDSEITGPGSYTKEYEAVIKAASGQVTFKGSGTISILASGDAISAKKGTINISEGTVNITQSGDDGIKAKNGTVNVSGGKLVMSECKGDGIQAENVNITGGEVDITTVYDNAATGYYKKGSNVSGYNTIEESGDTKTERVNVDTGSHKGIKAGTKASTKNYLDGTESETTAASGGLAISGGTINIDTTGAGLKANKVSGNDYSATSTGVYIIGSPDDGIQSNNDLVIRGGKITIASGDDGVSAAGSLSVTDAAELNVTAAYEGMEAAKVVIGTDGAASGPSVTLNTNDDGINASSKTVTYTYDSADNEDYNYTKTSASQKNNSCVIYSGTVTVKIDSANSKTMKLRNGSSTAEKEISYSASGDGIDCNGTLDIEGGTVNIFGQSSGDNSPLDHDSGFTLGSKATVFAAGSSGMAGESIPGYGTGVYISTGASAGGQPGTGGEGGPQMPGDQQNPGGPQMPGGQQNPGGPGGLGGMMNSTGNDTQNVTSDTADTNAMPGMPGGSGTGNEGGVSFSANETVSVTNGNDTIFSQKLPYAAGFVLFASPALTSGTSYTITNGTSSVQATAATPSGGSGSENPGEDKPGEGQPGEKPGEQQPGDESGSEDKPVVPVDESMTAVAGQQIDIRTLYYSDLSSIAKYRTVVTGTETNAASIGSVSAKGILTVKKEGSITVIPQKKEGSTYSDIENAKKINVTIIAKPAFKFTKPLTYDDQTINAYDYFTSGWTDKGFKIVKWTSSKESVAKVDSDGNITSGNVNGSTVISAYFGVKDENGANNTLKVSAILTKKKPAFSKQEVTMFTGQKLTVTMKNVSSVTDPSWKTSDDTKLQAGKVMTAKGVNTGKVLLIANEAGDYTLTSTIDGKDYTCTVKVKEPAVTRTSASIKVGKKIKVALKNTKLKKADIKWYSDAPEIAAVTEAGLIEGKTAGNTKIYTTVGTKRYECDVTVTAN